MSELSRPIDKEFNVEVEGGRFSTEFLNDLVDTHVNKIAPRYIKFQKLYEGKHKIQNRPRKDKNKPNNKLVNDFFGQTIDNTVGYFLGNPIVLNYTEPKKDKAPVEADPADVGVDLTELEDTAVQDELDKICSDNDKDDLFIEWGKEAMIKGLSHILVYQDEESHTKMMRVSPEDLIVVYKNSSTKEPAYKIRLYDIDTEDTKKTTHYAEVYSPTGAGADSTPKVKTEEEIRAELQKEYEKMADKRVTDAIKKKEKEWADKQAKEKMTEDERRQAEEQERLQAQAKRDLDLTIKGLKLDVVDAVQEMGLDAGFRNLIAVEDLATIADEDERKTKLTERVKGMKKLFDAEVAKEVAKAKAEFLKGSTPATGSSSNNKKDETKYDAYKKAGNVKGMLNEKLGAYRNKENEE